MAKRKSTELERARQVPAKGKILGTSGRRERRSGAPPADNIDGRLDEALKGTFPASDPVSLPLRAD
jgi:hypothetical protein